MADEDVIAIKLEVEGKEKAEEPLEKLSEKFEGLNEKVKEFGHEMLGMAKQAAAFAVGFQLEGLIESFKEFGHEVVNSAMELENSKRELTSLVTLLDTGKSALGDISEQADAVHDSFENMSLATGVAKSEMVDAFSTMAERAEAGADATEKLMTITSQMAVASKGLSGGMSALTAGWRDMEMGIVRPKNALVTLMKQTGLAEGSAKSIAKGLSKMLQGGDEKQIEKVYKMSEEAIGRMATKMKDMPLTFTQLLASLKGYREMFIETMGTPILKAIGPHLEKLKKYLETHRIEIEKLAETMGAKVGEWAEKAAEKIKEAFEYLKDHAQDIMHAFETGAGYIKSAIQFIVDHKELILGLMAAKIGGGAIGGLAEMAPGLGTAAGKALQGKNLATGVAAASVYEAGAQMKDLQKESGGLSLKSLMFLSAAQIAQVSSKMQDMNAKLQMVQHGATDVGASTKDLERFQKEMIKSGEFMVEVGELTKEQFESMKRTAADSIEAHAKLENAMDSMSQAGTIQAGGLTAVGQIQNFTNAFHAATEINAKEAENQARRILVANEALRFALAGTSGSVEDAIKRLKGLAGGEAADKAMKMPAMNFGPSSFTIHQDFKNQDPDRISLLFRRDIARNATSRVASRLSSPFGF